MITEVLMPKGRCAPLKSDHPAVGELCVGCHRPLQVGQVPTLVNGVPADEEEQAKANAGRAYDAQAQLAHEACAYPE